MATNKRMRRRAETPMFPQLEEEEVTPPNLAALQKRSRDLQRSVKRLKVEMAADRLGYPMGRQRKMTYAQTAAKRRKFLVQTAEFLITALLLVGACAWLYQLWLSRQ